MTRVHCRKCDTWVDDLGAECRCERPRLRPVETRTPPTTLEQTVLTALGLEPRTHDEWADALMKARRALAETN